LLAQESGQFTHVSQRESPPSLTLDDLAARIKAEHEATALSLKRGIEHAIKAGELLIQAKQLLNKHGAWLPWVEGNCAITPRMAQIYMRIAGSKAEIEAKAKSISHLTISEAVKFLAAPFDDEELEEDSESEKAGSVVPIRTANKRIGKARKPPNYERARIFREMKLGPGTMEKIKGTSLDNARELDELLFLNRGATEGENTPIVKQLVDAAARGETVSALAHDRKFVLTQPIAGKSGSKPKPLPDIEKFIDQLIRAVADGFPPTVMGRKLDEVVKRRDDIPRELRANLAGALRNLANRATGYADKIDPGVKPMKTVSNGATANGSIVSAARTV
jgi:hypothetical protein